MLLLVSLCILRLKHQPALPLGHFTEQRLVKAVLGQCVILPNSAPLVWWVRFSFPNLIPGSELPIERGALGCFCNIKGVRGKKITGTEGSLCPF